MAAKSDVAEKTLQYQDELPSLPLPSLESTMEKYLKSCKPLLTDEEYEHTEAVCEDFKQGIGKTLQGILEERAASERNWIEEWWETFAYLQPRYPSAVNINWHGVLPGNWGNKGTNQVEAATIFCDAILHFRQDFLDGKYPVEKMNGQPLCMYQFTRMFNSCVIPGEECDEIRVYEHDARHIAVLRNNAIWSLQVLDENGQILPLSDIARQFEIIREEATGMFDLERNPPVSILTAANRTKWAKAREYIQGLDECNRKSFETVEKALFCIVLSEISAENDEVIAQDCLLGDGRNKWFDKPFNLVIYENGRGGINGQHAWADALVVVRLFDYCVKYVNKNFKARTESAARVATNKQSAHKPKRLEWKLDHPALTAIEDASASISKLIHASDLKVLQFQHYGNDFLKRYKITPDFYVQMAIQLAYYKMYKKLPAIYETAHTRAFYHGRTETTRSLSMESLAFCKTMENPHSTDGQKWEALNVAIKSHFEQIKDCLMGQGIDRHMMGLYIVSEMSGLKPRPALFTDKAFTLSKKYLITTSNISGGRGSSPIWGGFSAAYDEGYGVCYALQPDRINFSVAAYHTAPETSAENYRRSLQTALLEMRELLLSRNVIYIGKSKI